MEHLHEELRGLFADHDGLCEAFEATGVHFGDAAEAFELIKADGSEDADGHAGLESGFAEGSGLDELGEESDGIDPGDGESAARFGFAFAEEVAVVFAVNEGFGGGAIPVIEHEFEDCAAVGEDHFLVFEEPAEFFCEWSGFGGGAVVFEHDEFGSGMFAVGLFEIGCILECGDSFIEEGADFVFVAAEVHEEDSTHAIGRCFGEGDGDFAGGDGGEVSEGHAEGSFDDFGASLHFCGEGGHETCAEGVHFGIGDHSSE